MSKPSSSWWTHESYFSYLLALILNACVVGDRTCWRNPWTSCARLALRSSCWWSSGSHTRFLHLSRLCLSLCWFIPDHCPFFYCKGRGKLVAPITGRLEHHSPDLSSLQSGWVGSLYALSPLHQRSSELSRRLTEESCLVSLTCFLPWCLGRICVL